MERKTHLLPPPKDNPIRKMTDLRIRFAQPEDKAAWLELWKSYCDFYETAVSTETTKELWRRILDPKYPVSALVADESGGLLGFTHFVLHDYTWGTNPVCYLEDLYVKTDARRKGVGEALIERLIQEAKKSGWDRVYWMTKSDNTAARGLYDKYVQSDGFVRYIVQL